MRIAIINQPFDTIGAPEERRGSVAIVNWELARCLAERHEVTQWAAAGRGQAAEEAFQSVRIRRVPYRTRALHKGVDLISGRVGRGDPYMGHDLFYRDYGTAIARSLSRERVDVVFVSTISQYGPLLRQALPKARLVLHVHGDELEYFDAERTARRLQAFDAVVTASEFVTQALKRRFPNYADRIATIRNGVDIDTFKPRAQAADGERKRLLFVSRVSPDKGVHTLIKAFEMLAQRRDDVEIDIVGKTGFLGLGFMKMHFGDPIVAPLQQYYGRGLIDGLRKEILGRQHSYIDSIKNEMSPAASSRVHWRGTASLEELTRLYSQASIFTLPSLLPEPFGMPIVEAMASGVPVVASRCGGIPEIVVEGVTGRLIERGDVGGLVQAYDELLDNSEQRRLMGAAGRARVEREFTWSQSAQRLEKVLFDLPTVDSA